MKYTREIIEACIGQECIYTVYQVNAEWKYSGIIKRLDSRIKNHVVLEGISAGLNINSIVSILVYDKLHDKKIWRLIAT